MRASGGPHAEDGRAGTVLILSRYGQLGASSRIRAFDYMPFLRKRGVKVEVQSLLSDEYLKRKYRGEDTKILTIASAYWTRMKFLMMADKEAVIWLEKELWPYVPFAIERMFLSGRKVVIDIDDAIFHNYEQHRSAVARHFLKRKLDSLFKSATLVTAGSGYLARRAIEAGAARVELVPTVVDVNKYQNHQWSTEQGFTVGWIGSPATRELLNPVLGVLQQVLAGRNDRFVTVGSGFGRVLFERHEEWAWGRETEAQQVAEFDVGIMPLPDRAFERGKCGYKLIQYMACGIPVVAAPVGANTDIVRHGENGLLAETNDEWRAALSLLKRDPELRQKMGEAGRRLVERMYSLDVTGPKVAKWLAEIANE